MTEAFSIVATSSPREIRTMKMVVAKLRDEEMDGIMLSQSWDDFQRRKGRVEAFGEIIDMLDQLEAQERA